MTSVAGLAVQATRSFQEEMHPNGAAEGVVKELKVWSCEAEAPVTLHGLAPWRQNLGMTCTYMDK